MINLSYQIHPGMFKYPSDPKVEIERTPASIADTRYKSGFTTFRLRSHHGTHIDAPAHKLPEGRTIDSYPDEKFLNYCLLIDLTKTDLLTRQKRELKREDLEQSIDQELYSSVQSSILYTGFCDEMRIREGRLTGQEKTDFEKTFPFLSTDAAEYLASLNPHLNILGIDSFSFDPQGSNSEAHRTLLSKDILLLETLVSLGQLKNEFRNGLFKLLCFTYPYLGFDAAQAKVLAYQGDI